MKRFLFLLLFMLATIIGLAQTTYFNSSPIVSGKESTRLYSLEIYDDYVIVTIEIEALKKNKRINYWTTPNTYIVSGETALCQVKGYYINGRIEQCGYNHQWGWSNVSQGAKYYYRLYFEGHIPEGLTKISIIDNGTQEWNGYSYNTVHSYCFRNYTINNPRKFYSSINSEYLAKKNIDANNDGICGIYEQIAGEQNYKLACVKENGSYRLIYLSSTIGLSWWQAGDIKANISRSASGVFKAEWFMSGKQVNRDTYIVFDGITMTVNMPTGTDPGEKKYLKMYPTSLPSYNNSQQEYNPERRQESSQQKRTPQIKQTPILKKQNVKK